jgi:hypothetical protein
MHAIAGAVQWELIRLVLCCSLPVFAYTIGPELTIDTMMEKQAIWLASFAEHA